MTNQFQSRVVVTGVIHCKNGARLQQQGDFKKTSPDLYALKDLSGMPYISASNFKNFLRRQVESLLKETLGPGFCCDSCNRDSACIRLGEARPDGGIYLSDLLTRYEDEERLLDAIDKHTCIACKLFGSQLVESRILIEDLKPAAWGGQFRIRRKGGAANEQELVEMQSGEEARVPEKYMIRIVLNNCEAWKRGLFIMGLSRAQNKLITLSSGKQTEQRIATIEELSVRSLESARQYFEKLAAAQATDGNDVTTEQLQHWIASLRDYLKLVSGFALAS